MRKKPIPSLRAFVAILLIQVLAAASSAVQASDTGTDAAFQNAINKANECIASRDFPCAEVNLRVAAGVGKTPSDKEALSAARSKLRSEKTAANAQGSVFDESKKKFSSTASLDDDEDLFPKRRREPQVQRESEPADDSAARIAQFGAVLNQSIASQANARAADANRAREFERQRKIAEASVARDQQRFAQERAATQAAEARARQQQSAQLEQAARQQEASAKQRQQMAMAESQEVERKRIQEAKDRAQAETQQRRIQEQRQDAEKKPVEPAHAVAANIPVPTKKASINTGRRAMDCVSVTREKEDIAFHNNCGKQIFVVWCGDLKYTKKRCGDGPAGNSFYTQSANVMAGDMVYARGVGDYHYAACEGGISFGKDEIVDRPDGSFTCVPR